jgi:hypothetical protein
LLIALHEAAMRHFASRPKAPNCDWHCHRTA